MSGQRTERIPPALLIDGHKVDLPKECADEFGRYFAAVNSISNYEEPFVSTKTSMEQLSGYRIAQACKNQSPIELNMPFSLQDIQLAIKSITRATSPGEDGINYDIIKLFTYQAQLAFLDIINLFWKH